MIKRNRFAINNIHFHLAVCMLALLMSLIDVQGQTASRPERGTGSVSSQISSQIDNINLQNGNVSLQIPLASLPQIAGGKLAYTLNAYYNSTLWNGRTEEHWGVSTAQGCTPTYTTTTVTASSDGGWKIGGGYEIIFRNASEEFEYLMPPDNGPCYGNEFTLMVGRFFKPILKMPDGSEHEMRIEGYFPVYQGNREYLRNYYKYGGTNSLPFDSTVRLYTVDGTYVTATYDPSGSYAIYLKDGTQVLSVSGGGQRIKDTNGNSILFGHDSTYNFDYAKDEQTNRLIKWSNSTYNSEPATKVEYQVVGGDWQSVWVVWGETTITGKYYPTKGWNIAGGPTHTGAECDLHAALQETFDVVREIVLPVTETGVAAQQYSFAYSSDTTVSATDTIKTTCTTSSSITRNASPGLGEISEITVPSGATTEYDFRNDGTHKIGLLGLDGAADTLMQDAITEKRVGHDGVTDTYTYDMPFGAFAEFSSMENPDGSTYSEKYYPKDFLRSYQAGTAGFGGLTYRTTQSDKIMIEKHWTLLGGTMYAYGSSANKVTFNPVVDTEYTTLLDGSGNRVKMSAKKFEYDYNGELTKTTEYDWFSPSAVTFGGDYGTPSGVPSGATVLRVINNSYYNQAANSSDNNAYHKRTVGSTSTVLLGFHKETTIGDGTTAKGTTRFSYDSQSYGTAPATGNLTTTSAWDDVGSQWMSAGSTYSSHGNLLTRTNANGGVTQFTYSSINGYTDLYPTQTVLGYGTSIARTSEIEYDFYTGKITTTTDVDNSLSTATEYDILGRPTKIKSAVGTALESWVTNEYSDHYRRVIVRSDLETVGDGKSIAIEHYDQLGRVRLTRTLDAVATGNPYDETSGTKIETRYLNSNPYSYQLVSNPFRADTATAATGEPTMGWTRSKTWSDGSKQEMETFSGAALPAPLGANTGSTGLVTLEKSANATTVTDQAGKTKRSIMNGLGQLVRTDEPDDTGQLGTVSSPNQPTSHTYDVLGNLVSIQQNGNTTQQCGGASSCNQTRTFTYSSLARLISAENPESGTISYQYDANGNLTQKSQSRSASVTIVTSFIYDALNRVTQRTYSGESGYTTPMVTYTYDNVTHAKGQLTKVTTGSVSSPFSVTDYQSFDLLGRVTQSQQTTDGVAYNPMTYTYNLSGALIEETYPSGRTVKNVYDQNGDLAEVQSKKNSTSGFWTYAGNFDYNAAGKVTSLRLGNGHWEKTTFNSRLQPTQTGLGIVQGATDLLQLDYNYGSTQNNGNVQSQTITVGGSSGFTAVQSYAYDSLNRLQTAAEKPQGYTTTDCNNHPENCWQQTFTYDRYGNRKFDEANTTTLPKHCNNNTEVCASDRKIFNPSANPADNRLSANDGYVYDSAGNIMIDANSQQYLYNAENKMVQAKAGSTNVLGTYYYDGDGRRVKKDVPGGGTTIFIYNVGGELIEEYSTQLNPTPEVSYLTSDSLNSPRINTNENGAVISRQDFYPFGEKVSTVRNPGNGYKDDSIRKQFTGYDRDDESSFNFAEARYMSSRLGRFSSPDPAMSSAAIFDPQSFNRYAYVSNNPLNYTDPTGMTGEAPKSKDDSKGGDCPEGKTCQKDADGNEYYEENGAKVYVGAGVSTVAVKIVTEVVKDVSDRLPGSTIIYGRPFWQKPWWVRLGNGALWAGSKVIGVVGLILTSPTSTSCGASPGMMSNGNGGCYYDPAVDVRLLPRTDTQSNPQTGENAPTTQTEPPNLGSNWTCLATGHLTPHGDTPGNGEIITAIATDKNKSLAAQKAKDAVQSYQRPGYHMRHVQVKKCWRGNP